MEMANKGNQGEQYHHEGRHFFSRERGGGGGSGNAKASHGTDDGQEPRGLL